MSYYVYAYLREDGSPYYIGKGSGNRAYVSQHTVNLPSKDRIVILHENLEETDAFEKEKYYISLYGRKNNGTGILRNLTDGGEGSSGYKHNDETKLLISEILTGITKQPFTDEHRRNISIAKSGKPWNGKHTEQSRSQIGIKNSINRKGKNLSEITKNKLRCKKWYTNGTDNILIDMKIENCVIPEGFYPGRFVAGSKHSEETKQKLRKPKTEETKLKMKLAWEKRKLTNV